ncbi:diguanylate cyclase [Acetobacterium wieringae]|uniref:sensor domain-containing diguanylate cyclase n=1 Tax=Acetobacterium wieringae TaxID=52694 RepID=UPI0026EA0992|nr:diguanylate cyclase [Acetobacterium wieringae]
MISKDARTILEYFQSLLNDLHTSPVPPENISSDNAFIALDQTIKTIRNSAIELRNGNLSHDIRGRGYVLGSLKNLQASLRNLTWITKTIASGDFSQRVHFLGDFSEAFNSMTEKLESSIHELEEARSHFEMVFQTIPDATVITKVADGTLIAYNRAFMEATKFTDVDLTVGLFNIRDLYIDASQRESFIKALEVNGFVENLEICFYGKNNERHIGLVSSKKITIEGMPHALSVIRDITELKAIEAKLQQSEERHRLLADNAADVIWTMDLTGRFTYISPSVEKLRGYTVEEVMAQSQEEVLCPGSLIQMQEGLARAINSVQNGLPFQVYRGELEQPCKDGTTVWTEATVSGIYSEDGRFIGMLGVTRDISERKLMEEEIRRLSITDKLTQSFNRLKLDETLEQQFDWSVSYGLPFATIILDIDHFKLVNDTYGHQVGDRVLIELVEVLHDNVRNGDVVGRWGGEEFLIIMPNTTLADATVMAEWLRQAVASHAFTTAGQVTISLGVAAFATDNAPETIVSRADTALYKAKEKGRNRVEVC